MTTQISHNLIKSPYRKNIVINGALDIWQRGTSLAIGNSSAKFLADRLQYYNDRGAGGATYLRSTDTPTVAESGTKFNYSAEIDITAALASPTGSNEVTFSYNVEGYDYVKIAGKTATLSFWVKSNKTGTYALSFRNMVAASQRRTYTIEYTIDTANTWERKTFTVPMTGDEAPLGSPADVNWNYTNGQGLIISWALMSAVGLASTSTFNTWQDGNTPYTDNQTNLFDNTSNYFRMTGIQLEEGDAATDFELRHIAEELSLCQRYYINMDSVGASGYASAASQADRCSTTVVFPTEMRATPSLDISDGTFGSGNTSGSVPTTRDSGANSYVLGAAAAGAGSVYWVGGPVYFDSEL